MINVLKNTYVYYPIASKFTEIIKAMKFIVHTKNEYFSL